MDDQSGSWAALILLPQLSRDGVASRKHRAIRSLVHAESKWNRVVFAQRPQRPRAFLPRREEHSSPFRESLNVINSHSRTNSTRLHTRYNFFRCESYSTFHHKREYKRCDRTDYNPCQYKYQINTLGMKVQNISEIGFVKMRHYRGHQRHYERNGRAKRYDIEEIEWRKWILYRCFSVLSADYFNRTL